MPSTRIPKSIPWVLIVLAAALLVSCAHPTQREDAPCTITVQPGESLQATIDRAPAGAVICLPAGAWTESLRVMKPVTLRGAGPTRTTIRGALLAQPVIAVGPLVGTEGPVVLAGIAVTGAAGGCSEPGGCAHGLLIAGAAVVEAERCAFSGNTGTGISLRDEARATVRDSTISGNNGYGVQIVDQAEAVLISVTLSGNRSTGIWLADEARLVLATSTVTKCEGQGLWVRDRSHVTATDSTISSCDGYGLWVRDQASAALSECTIAGHKSTGVWIEHAAEVTFTSCTIERAWDGIEARDSSRVQIVDCTVSTVRWDGIKLQGSARATVRGSTISGGRGSGIHVGGGAQAEISHNRIDSWAAHGILSLARSAPWGEGNRMRGNGVDLAGNLPGSLRAPLVPPSQEEVLFPNPGYATVQEAVDALLPGGRLVLREGIYAGGITIEKPLRIEADGTVLLTARASGEAPVISLVGGADLVMAGVALGNGSEGLSMGASARAALTDCVLSDNSRGIHAADEAEISLLRCSLSRNSQGGLGLWDQAQATLQECALTANGVFGIAVGGKAQLVLAESLITESGWSGGIVLRDSAQAVLEENTIIGNYGTGVALYHGLCLGARYVFTGWITGGGNVFSGNYKGDVCPGELAFLSGEGGELDFRR